MGGGSHGPRWDRGAALFVRVADVVRNEQPLPVLIMPGPRGEWRIEQHPRTEGVPKLDLDGTGGKRPGTAEKTAAAATGGGELSAAASQPKSSLALAVHPPPQWLLPPDRCHGE